MLLPSTGYHILKLKIKAFTHGSSERYKARIEDVAILLNSPTPDLLRPACLRRTDDSYHTAVSAIIKSRKHKKLESGAVDELPLAVFGLHVDWIWRQVGFNFRGKHLTPRNCVGIGIGCDGDACGQLLLNRWVLLLAFLEQTIESGGSEAVLSHENAAVVGIIVLKRDC